MNLKTLLKAALPLAVQCLALSSLTSCQSGGQLPPDLESLRLSLNQKIAATTSGYKIATVRDSGHDLANNTELYNAEIKKNGDLIVTYTHSSVRTSSGFIPQTNARQYVTKINLAQVRTPEDDIHAQKVYEQKVFDDKDFASAYSKRTKAYTVFIDSPQWKMVKDHGGGYIFNPGTIAAVGDMKELEFIVYNVRKLSEHYKAAR